MGPKKLTAKQQQAKQEKEKQLRFARQQGSIQMLSKPSPRTMQSLREQEEIAEVLGGSPAANRGLHMVAEHEIITKEMPDPNVIGAIGRKKTQQEIQAWDSPERETSQLSMIQGSGGKDSKRNSSVLPGIQMGRRDSEELQAYSRQELGSIEDSTGENIHQIKPAGGSKSKNSGPVMNSIKSDSNKKGKKDPKANTNIAFKDKKPIEQQITVENYTKSRESERDVHQRMQQSVIDKTREKNQSTNENKDLLVQKQTAEAQKGKSIDGKSRASKTQVAFDDQMALGQDIDNSRGSVSGAGKTKGILKSQKGGLRDQRSPQQTPSASRGVSDTDSNQGAVQKTSPKVAGSRLTNAMGSGGESSIFGASGPQIAGARYTTGQQRVGYKPHFTNLPLTGLESSSAASGTDDLQMFHTSKVNKPREPIVRPPSISYDDADGDIGQQSSSKGSKKRVRAGSEKKAEITWRDTMKSIEEDQQAAIDRRMRYMVYQYTRPGGKLEQEESLSKTIDYSGIGYLEGKLAGDDFFAHGVMNAQDRKLERMKNKLNQSVDFAAAKQSKNTIEENRIAREKAKYEQLGGYKKVSEAMTYRNEIFEQNIERALDPVNSPLQPAVYARQKQESERHKTRAREELANSDAYSARMAEVDKFLGPRPIAHEATLKHLSPKAKDGDDNAADVPSTPSESLGQQHESSQMERRHHGGPAELGASAMLGPESGLEIYRIPEATEEHLETQSPLEPNRKGPRTLKFEDGPVPVKPILKRGQSGNRMLAEISNKADTRNPGLVTGSSLSHDLTDSQPPDAGSFQQTFLNAGQEKKDVNESEVDFFLETQAKDDVVEQGEDGTKSEGLSPEGSGPPDLNLYNIRNHPKLPPKAKQVADRRDIQNYTNKQVSEAKEEMRQADKVFKMIHDYCRENLTVSYNLLDKHVEDLLDPDCVVSPLLKYFNDLARHSNFRLPSLAVLEFDQRFFKKYVERLRRAQQVEIRWVRAETVRAARKTLMTAFDQARGLLQAELKSTLYKYEQMEQQMELKQKENEKLARKIIELEKQISEQRVFTKATISKTFNDDHELFLANGGPGGAYEQFNNGEVLQDIDSYHAQLKEFTKFTIDIINADIKEQGAEVLKKTMQHGLRDAGRLANQSRTNVTSAMRDSVGSPQGSPDRVPSELKPSKRNLPGFPLLDPDALLPTKEDLMTQLEPFLKPVANLYGGSLRLTLEDRQAVMAQEIYKHHKMHIKRLVEKNEAQRAENFANAVLMEQLNITNGRLQKENDRFVFEIKDLKAKFAADKARIKKTAKDRLREIQEACETELRQAKGLLGLEIKVTSAVTDRLIKDNEVQAVKLRKFATLLRIPRLHWNYIEKHGVDEFVDYCEDIVRRERALKMAEEANKKKLELRSDYAVLKKIKNVGGFSERHRHNMTDVKTSAPFELQVPVDTRREDHPAHAKTGPKNQVEKDNEAVKRQLERIALLQSCSLLDLSELLRKHKDKQPQLLATLQPDLKSQLLHNPMLMKSLEKIERQDPINKRAAEIKQLIQSLKAEKYERKFFTPFPELESGQTTKLSRSVIFDESRIENALKTPGNKSFKSILKHQLSNSISVNRSRKQFQTLNYSPEYSRSDMLDKSQKDEDTVIIQLNTQQSEQNQKQANTTKNQEIDKKKLIRLNQTSDGGSLRTLDHRKPVDEDFDTEDTHSQEGFPAATKKHVRSGYGVGLTNQLSSAEVAGRLSFNMRNAVSTKIVGHAIRELHDQSKPNILDSNQTSQKRYASILKTQDDKKISQNISPNRADTFATMNPLEQNSSSLLKKGSFKNLTADGSSNPNLAMTASKPTDLSSKPQEGPPVKEVDTLKIPMQQSLQNLERSGKKLNDSVLTQKLSE